jgi:hypothetical protein
VTSTCWVSAIAIVEGAVTAAHNQNALAEVILGVLQPIKDVGAIFTRDVQLAR